MKTVCPCCNQSFNISDDMLNCEVKCGVCGNVFTVLRAVVCPVCGAPNTGTAHMCFKCSCILRPEPADYSFCSDDDRFNAGGRESITMFTALKRYFDFSGRATRKEYWLHTLLLLIVYGPIWILRLNQIFAFILDIFLLLPSLAVGVRRLHDIDRSGWWILIQLIPLIGPLMLFLWMCRDSYPEDNRYGKYPK